MNREEDHAYFQRRAEQERLRADGATDPSVAEVHRQMAASYRRRLAEGTGSSLQLVSGFTDLVGSR